MRRVLFISYFFPPLANSGTQRALKFCQYLPDFGWQPTVLTVDRAPDQHIDRALLAEIPHGTPVARAPMASRVIADMAARFCGRRVAGGIEWRLRDRFRRPDLYALWRPAARRTAARILRRTRHDVVFATGYPWTSLLVGADAASAAALPLVADFRDPWTTDDVFAGADPHDDADRRLEREVVRRAAAVISVSETMTEDMRRAHPDVDRGRFATILNGFDPAAIAERADCPAAAAGTFRIVYTGVWRAGYGPALLYGAIAALQQRSAASIRNLEVIAAGFPAGPAAEYGISDRVRELGIVSHREAVGWMATAHVLFAPVAPGSYQRLALPGKLFEYLGTGRPVVLAVSTDGEAARVARDVGGCVRIDSDDRASLERLIERGCRAEPFDMPPLDRTALARYERRAQTQRLAGLLDRVVQAPTSTV